MALDDLKAIIETLRERIQTHHNYLKSNETRTRQVLIDPMLDALGWDVGDPNAVQLEYGIKQKRADYALINHNKPLTVIEAKSLGTSLDDKVKMQVLNYANTNGIDYMAVTDGDHWQVFDVFKKGQLADRILMNFQLTRDQPYACALQALGLWRPNLASGEPKEAVAPTMIESSPEESEPSTPEPSSEKAMAKPSDSGNWDPLSSLKVSKDKVPAYIKFPNSKEKQLVYWIDVLVNAAEHLIETGKISAQNCPVKAKGHQNYLLHTEAVHPTGKPFKKKRKVKGELWLQTSYPTSEATHNIACWLLDRFGVSPSTVLVRTNRS